MNLNASEIDGAVVLALSGEVDLQQSPKVRKALMEYMFDKREVLVDMAGVSYIDSSGIASLVEAYQMARRNRTLFALVKVSPAAMRVLQLARLDKVFAIFSSVEDALKARG